MHKIIEKIKKQSKVKKIILILVAIILLSVCIVSATIQITRQIKIWQLENKPLLEYEIKQKIDSKKYQILVKVNSTEGIESIKYLNQNNKEIQINPNGKLTVGIDYVAEDNKDYNFTIKIKGKEEKTETLHFEIPRIQGKYTLNNGLYVNEPDLTGYNENYTRYLNVDSTGNLVIGNWIKQEKSENWYNYKNSQWANIYVEKNGLETYYVWIPRYCFKLDQENERSDVKFIDVYNNYIDENGETTTWEELENEGYQIPEAFEFSNTQLPGYWAMKYTAGERDSYTINFEAIASKTKIKMQTISANTTGTIAKYTYAINGNIVKEATTTENFEYAMNTEENNIVNITALDENGKVIGSMTKECKQAKVNIPDLSGFKQDTTFYVTYDSNGQEHSTIPITETAPEDWYDYGDSRWANIVTRNNELETYYTWIPRYEFKLDYTAERSNVNFIEGTSKQTTDGYQIPEAFWFDKNGDGTEDEGEQLTGYWAMKYTAGDAAAPRFSTEVVATSSSIKTKGITGTAVGEGQKYKYYINGEYKGEKTSKDDTFEFSGLSSNTKYTILVEIRESATDKYVGTIVKQISTIDANKPELTGFNSNMTYYVLYDESGNETIGDKIKNDGSNIPSNWYNYSNSKWANIVVTDGKVKNGKIENATMTTYYTWIPRYEFTITSSQYAQPAAGRTEVRFISGTSKETDIGYQIPEAFWFDKNSNGIEDEGEQLTGYWAMKYTAGE